VTDRWLVWQTDTATIWRTCEGWRVTVLTKHVVHHHQPSPHFGTGYKYYKVVTFSMVLNTSNLCCLVSLCSCSNKKVQVCWCFFFFFFFFKVAHLPLTKLPQLIFALSVKYSKSHLIMCMRMNGINCSSWRETGRHCNLPEWTFKVDHCSNARITANHSYCTIIKWALHQFFFFVPDLGCMKEFW